VFVPGEIAHRSGHEFGNRAGEILLEPDHHKPGSVEFLMMRFDLKTASQHTDGSNSGGGPKGHGPGPRSG
jgi:hypothetical protein